MLFPTGMPIQVFWDLSASECYEVIFLTRRFNKALIYLPESQKCFPNFKHSTQANIFTATFCHSEAQVHKDKQNNTALLFL